MPSVQWSLICDYYLIDQAGRLSLLGIFDRLVVPQLPVVYPYLHVVTQWHLGSARQFRLETRLWTPTEQVLATSGELPVGPVPNDQHLTINSFANLTLERAGQYLVELLADGETARFYPLQVTPHAPPATYRPLGPV
ncbi:MAG: hypothetical protein IRZ14_04225 [Chloroflexi bacterium]|nr:hypothetical protein [Chloroflexota bacterium]